MYIELEAPLTACEATFLLGIRERDYIRALKSGLLKSSGSIRAYPPCRQQFHTFWDIVHFDVRGRMESKDIDFFYDEVGIQDAFDSIHNYLETYSKIPPWIGESYRNAVDLISGDEIDPYWSDGLWLRADPITNVILMSITEISYRYLSLVSRDDPPNCSVEMPQNLQPKQVESIASS